MWVITVGKCMLAFSDVARPAGLALWAGMSFMIAVPFGWIVGRFVSPLIYERCNQVGVGRLGVLSECMPALPWSLWRFVCLSTTSTCDQAFG